MDGGYNTSLANKQAETVAIGAGHVSQKAKGLFVHPTASLRRRRLQQWRER